MYELNQGDDPGNMFRTGGFSSLTNTAVGTTETTVRVKLGATNATLSKVLAGFSMMYDSFTVGDVYDQVLDSVGKVSSYTAGGATLTGAVTPYIATPTGTSTPTASTLNLLASPTATVKSDGSTSVNIIVTALNATHAAVPGVTVTMETDFGILGSATVVTGTSAAPGTVTFIADASKYNRTATIKATAGTATAQIPVQIVGTKVAVNSSGGTLPDSGTLPVTLTITAKDAGGNNVPNAAVTLTQTGKNGGQVKFYTPASGVAAAATTLSGVTDATGTFTSAVIGASGGAGAVTVSATALGTSATTDLTVTPSAATFGIDQLTLNGSIAPNNPNPATMKIGDTLVVEVNAPNPISNVTFATTTGKWNGGGTTATVSAAGGVVCSGLPATVAGKACATLTTTQAGVANVQVYDAANNATSATLTVYMTSGAPPNSVTLQPTPSVVPRSVGTTTGSSTLIALVRDVNNQPVGGAPVAFSIVNPTGGGETVSPVVVYSAATTANGLNLGEARSSFTSGSLSTGAPGVQIRASVVGTSVATNTTPSGNDATIVIGGTAGSVAFGFATLVGLDNSNANYTRDMSVLVADSNGNPVPNTVVSLSLWPIAWSTGTLCTPDTDGDGKGTFFNEDINENLILDAGEDGTRNWYSGAGSPGIGTIDGIMTPPNSAGGTLTSKKATDAPGTVTTDATGVGAFTWTYTKNSAIWTLARIRATAVVQGSATVGQVIHRLDPVVGDVKPDCILPNSPYKF